MFQYQKYNRTFFVLGNVLKHNLSNYQNEDVITKIWRFRDYKYSLRIIIKSKTIIQIVTLEVVLFLRSFLFALKYRNINFLK